MIYPNANDENEAVKGNLDCSISVELLFGSENTDLCHVSDSLATIDRVTD